MKIKQIICVVTILLSGMFSLVSAQEGCVGFVPVMQQQSDALSEKTIKSLQLKTQQIITRNNAGTTALCSAFVMYPKLNILSCERLETGMKAVIQLKGEYSLFVQNIMDNSYYGSITIDVTGSGFSEQEAYNSLVQSIKSTDPHIARFVASAKKKIEDYYTANGSLVIKNAATLAAQSNYEHALALLNSVPVCVSCYDQVSGAIQTTFKSFSNKQCAQIMQLAQTYFAQKDYEAALEIVSQINPESSCASDAKALINRTLAAIDAADKTKAAEMRYIFDQQNKLESQAIKAAADIATAYYSQTIEATFILW